MWRVVGTAHVVGSADSGGASMGGSGGALGGPHRAVRASEELVPRTKRPALRPDGGLRPLASSSPPRLHRADPAVHHRRQRGSRRAGGRDQPVDHQPVRTDRRHGRRRGAAVHHAPRRDERESPSSARCCCCTPASPSPGACSGCTERRGPGEGRHPKRPLRHPRPDGPGPRGGRRLRDPRASSSRFPLEWLWAIPISLATGLVLWTSIPYLLLDRQVHWRRLLVVRRHVGRGDDRSSRSPRRSTCRS